jgi:tripartite-type tricarboxylate transporter receptor subunit TctC
MQRITMFFRRFSPVAVCLAAVFSAVAPAHAQGYPSRPVRLVVPFPPGGVSDVLARILQPKFAEFLGQPVVIDNKGGAGGTIGAAEAARAAPDGHTIMIVADPYAVMNHLYVQSPPIFSAFDHIVMMTTSPGLLVAATSFAPNSVSELIAAAKAGAGAVTYATPGAGSFNHLGALLLEQAAGVRMTHVPYKGGAPMVQAMLGGQVNIMFTSASLTMRHVKAGKLKALAVASRRLMAQLPDVPSLTDTFPGIQMQAWSGIIAPAGIPREASSRIHRDILRTLADPEVRRRLAEGDFEVAGGSPEEFLSFVRGEHDRLGKVIRDYNVKVD